MNRLISRAVVVMLCRELGHDPDAVVAINVYPDRISVVYDHFIVGADVETLGGES